MIDKVVVNWRRRRVVRAAAASSRRRAVELLVRKSRSSGVRSLFASVPEKASSAAASRVPR
ncbi:hypothetical protein ACFQ10_39290 [Streptomyces indonesiensis]